MPEATMRLDVDLMERCIALGKSSVGAGEYPFAAVIARRNGAFLCESINKVRRDHDVNRHAEVAAIAEAQAIRGEDLSDCTIYSTVEPCAQCSYAIREAQIGRVVYGLRSPLMGGHSRWNILSDAGLSDMLPEVFRPSPEIVSGFMQNEVEILFRQWNPLIWQIIKARGIFGGDAAVSDVQPPGSGGLVAGLARLFRARVADHARRTGADADGGAQDLPR